MVNAQYEQAMTEAARRRYHRLARKAHALCTGVLEDALSLSSVAMLFRKLPSLAPLIASISFVERLRISAASKEVSLVLLFIGGSIDGRLRVAYCRIA